MLFTLFAYLGLDVAVVVLGSIGMLFTLFAYLTIGRSETSYTPGSVVP